MANQRPKNPEAPFQFLMSLPADTARRLDEFAKKTDTPRVAAVRSAVEALLAERGGEKLSVELSDELRIDLAALQDALDGASVQRMIARALREYVDKTLEKNPGIQERFSETRKQIREQGGRIIEFRPTRMA
jgi:predicted transcriptional regulator